MVYARFWGSHWSTVLFKYLWQSLQTFVLLIRRKPDTVFVMTPPVAACAAVWLYALTFRRRFVIDAHTGAFLDPRWRKIIFLHRFFSRRAERTLVTNDYLGSMVEAWGARHLIVPDVPVVFPEVEKYEFPPGRNVVLVSSFAWDEPIGIFLEAAALVPEVTFHVTGDYEGADPELLAARPSNVVFTGFLSKARYAGLLQGSDAVISLTTLDHTMQRGAYEAVYLGRPVIVSDFPILRESFPKGAVYVGGTRQEIARGVRDMMADVPRFEREAGELKSEKLERWQRVMRELEAILD